MASSLLERPVDRLVTRLKQPSESEILSQPAFLLQEAPVNPSSALDLALRELARLTSRVPVLLDRVRENSDDAAPSPDALRSAGLTLAGTIKKYLANLLEQRPGRNQTAAALLLENAAGTASALHGTLAELASAASDAADHPATGRMVDALYMLMGFVADYAHDLGVEDPAFVLNFLGDRNAMMSQLRQRVAGDGETGSLAQDALFRMTILFERAVWLARRLVTDMRQAQQAMGQ